MADPAPKITPGSKNVEPGSVLPRTAWPGVLAETVVEVFSIMVGVNVAVTHETAEIAAQTTGIVGIAGAMCANFILRCSTVASARLAAQMLGIDPDSPDSEGAACDALGEVCNIVAGYFKAKVGLGDACMLSVPTIITGQDYKFHSHAFERLEFAVIFEGELLCAILEIAQ